MGAIAIQIFKCISGQMGTCLYKLQDLNMPGKIFFARKRLLCHRHLCTESISNKFIKFALMIHDFLPKIIFKVSPAPGRTHTTTTQALPAALPGAPEPAFGSALL